MARNEFIAKAENCSATVGVIGLGYVGLPLLTAFSANGFPTVGFDIDEKKCGLLNKGKSYIKHIPDNIITKLKNFHATTDFSEAGNMDALLICVPTPLTPERDPDMTYISSTLEQIAPFIRKGQLVCLESTSYPGTTAERIVPFLEEKSGLQPGKDFYVAYSPEREDPNNKDFTTSTIPKVVGGYSSDCLHAATALYNAIVDKVVPVSDTKTAEATKLMENIFRGVNIALVNELKIIFDKMGINVWEVIEAASTKPFGFMPFYPGPGLGGHCIPIDPFFLSWKARQAGVTTRFIELAGEINRAMPEFVVTKTMKALNRQQKAVNGSSILLMGMAYKPDVDDMRESPALKLMRIFESEGAHVDFHDPYIQQIPKLRKYSEFHGRSSVPLENIGKYDCVVIVTNHSGIDYRNLADNAQLTIDTRHACPDMDSVIRA